MKEIFYEIIEEASRGKIIIDGEEWPIGFNTIIMEDNKERKRYESEKNITTLIIKREEEFLELLDEYLKLENKLSRKIPSFYTEPEKSKTKWILSYLFVNATTEDFINPNEFLRKKIDFLKDNSLKKFNQEQTIPMGEILKNSNLQIKNEQCAISMETPFKLTMSLQDKETEEKYDLPSIYYGIREENGKKTCYIYSMLSPINKSKEEYKTKYQSKMNRIMYKINANLETDETSVENIKDVSMPFVFSLNVFISILQAEHIETIKVVPYLPLRYLSRELMAEESLKKEELQNRNQKIQENLTNKLIRTFRRLEAQNKNMKIELYPYEMDEYLTIRLEKQRKELDNMILEETSNKIMEESRNSHELYG